MLSAHVLIQTELGKVADVAQRPEGVQLAEDLADPYHVIARRRHPVWISWAGWWSPTSRPWTASPAP